MNNNNLYFLLLLLGFFAICSCSTDEDPMEKEDEMEMMDDDDDDDNMESNLGEAPTFVLKTTSDETIESSQFKDKNLVIFFFGYNCPPCKAVGPDVESKLYQKFKGDADFAMIGADQWEGNNAGVDNFQNTTGVTFPLGVKGAAMAKDYGSTYDRLVVVNAEGNIVYRGNSIAKNNLDEVIGIVGDLLK